MGTRKIPHTVFDSRFVDEPDGFDAWRQSISPVFDVTPWRAAQPGVFRARTEAYHLGDILIGATTTGPQRFRNARTPDRVDHILVQAHQTGGYVGRLGEEDKRVTPGDVSIIDLARPLETYSFGAGIISVLLPRDAFAHRPEFLNGAHGVPLDPARSNFLTDYLSALVRRLPSLTQGEAPEISRITRDMILACAMPDLDAQARVEPQLDAVMRDRIKRHIDRSLGSPELGVETICKTMGVSRSRLYRLLESEGGVARCIQRRRLLRVRACLEDPAEQRSIGELAQAYGFPNQAHFTRRFRAAFEVSPSEVRQRAAEGAPVVAAAEEPPLTQWIRQLTLGNPR